MKSSAVVVKNLVKKYKKAKNNAVDGISFSVKQGEFFALLGPNGAGKTTTISVLTTTLTKTSGEVTTAGHDLDRNPSEVRKKIGVIFQNPSLDKNLTAEENIRIHAVLYGLFPFRPTYPLMPKAYKDRVLELSKILGIEDSLNQPIKSFSGGMKRKLEIVRSLIHKPKILFLDEPTSGLDPASRKGLWKYLIGVRKQEKTTIFLTTHYLEEAEDADRVCVINNGKIVSLGTPTKLKSDLIQKYVLLDAKDRNKLKKELFKNKLDFFEENPFKIAVNGITAQEIISHIKTPLSVLDIHNPTLEEAYLDIVEKKQEKGVLDA